MNLCTLDSIFDRSKFERLVSAGFLVDIDNMEKYAEGHVKSAKPSPKFWSGKRVFVSGAAGMVGSTIIDILVGMGAEVHGAVKRHGLPSYPYLQSSLQEGKLKLAEVDLRDYSRVAGLIKEIEPHVIFHQAAESFVPTSIQQPSHVVENNCVSTVNLLEAATKDDKNLEGLQLACSSEQYGFIKSIEELPVKETNELRPTSTYAATKVFTEYLAKSYFYSYRTPTVITRTFNQEGPRRGPQFFTARIAIQVNDCLKEKAKQMVMGNPNSVRDFTHVHDSAAAQVIAVEKCNRGEAYNICSGKGITTGDYAKLALRTFSLEGKVPIMIDKSLLRPYERGEALIDGFIGNNAKFSEKTGWKPVKGILDIIRDGVAHYSA